MGLYTNRTQIGEHFPGLITTDNTAPDVEDNALNETISFYGDRIEEFAINSGYTLPSTEPVTLTNVWYLIEGLNLLPCVDTVIRVKVRAYRVELSYKISRPVEIGDILIDEYLSGKMNAVFNQSLPTTPLATPTDCAITTPSFVASSTSHPSTATIMRWIQQIGAIVRAVAAIRGCEQDTTKMSAKQLRAFRDLVAQPVRAMVLRVRALQYGYTPELYELINSYFKTWLKNMILLEEGGYGATLPSLRN